MCPWPLSATEGKMYPRWVLYVETPAVVSKSVPDCVTLGVVVRLPISYQRAPMRLKSLVVVVFSAAPVDDTSTPWAVQSEVTPLTLFLWIAALNSLESETSIRLLLDVPIPLAHWRAM